MIFLHKLAWRLIVIFVLYMIAFAVETIYPADDFPNRRGLLLNWLHCIILHGADLSIGAATLYYLQVTLYLIRYNAPIRIQSNAFLLSLLAMAMGDFFYYWFHRLQHYSKWMWAEHELHHSDEHMNITTNHRHHFLEIVLQPLFCGLPMMLLFDPPGSTIISIAVGARALSHFNHINSRIRFGWFNHVLSSPQNHRVHHSKSEQHIDKNFATIFPVWDILFGTYYHPANNEWPMTGVEGLKVESLWKFIILPITALSLSRKRR